MKRLFVKYYSLQPVMKKSAPFNLFYHEEKGELYISANLRLCSSIKMAHIESEKLANEFAEAIMPKLQKRYGNDFDLNLVVCTTNENKKTIETIKKDSEIIKKRLKTSSFACNVVP